MKLNDVWGYGQLFAFSGLDGQNKWANDFVATLTSKKVGIRFELHDWVELYFPVESAKFSAITGDMIDAKTQDGTLFIAFVDADTVVGYTPILPEITGEKGISVVEKDGVKAYSTAYDTLLFVSRKDEGGYKFVFHRDVNGANVSTYLDVDLDAIKKSRYAYFENKPKCKKEAYEKLYYKALSVQKVNVHSAEALVPCTWTTPDRVPHRHLWLWDSVFHALAIVTYNEELAKDSIRAILSQTHENGFIPHMVRPNGHSDMTQPQVLAWGVWEVYKKTGDLAFMKECTPKIEKFLEWCIASRDKDNNGLLEWASGTNAKSCRCDESGLDNSPRFDTDEQMNVVDFSTFLAHDSLYLSYIFEALGNVKASEKWRGVYEYTKKRINDELWDDEDGVYYDKFFSGSFSKVLTPMNFFPLMANIPSKKQVERMVKVLTDKTLLWTTLPLATVSQTHPTFSTDMWRGGVWLNINYFIIKGLKQYGYDEIAEQLKTKLLDEVQKWYERTGCVFEFYAPDGETSPFNCERKGDPITPPDWRKHIHSITDYNWTSCFTLMFIQDELYIGEKAK